MRRSSQLRQAAAHGAMSLLALVLAGVIPVIAQSPLNGTPARNGAAPPAPIQDQTDLWKVKPDISGKRNGVFAEPYPMDFTDRTGYISLFDGNSLNGWDGRPGVWSVEDGA